MQVFARMLLRFVFSFLSSNLSEMMMGAFLAIIWAFVQGIEDINQTQHTLTSDILFPHLLPNLDTNTLMEAALSINKKWSTSAIHVLSSRTKFLSIGQMKLILNRIDTIELVDLSSERAIIKSCLVPRADAISHYNNVLCACPIRLPPKSDFYLFKMDENIRKSYCCFISIHAMIKDDNENRASLKQTRLEIKRDPIIQISEGRILFFASDHGMHYHRCSDIQFIVHGNQEILHYDFRIYLSMKQLFLYKYNVAATINDVYVVHRTWNKSDSEFWLKTCSYNCNSEHMCYTCIMQ